MSSISIALDVTKFNKARIVDKSYSNREGQPVSKKEYRVSLVELKEPKLIKDGGNWLLKKTHFVCEEQTKEERASKTPSVYVGEGFQFFDKVGESENQDVGVDADLPTDDIPF